MCFNAKSSLLLFSVAILCSVYLLFIGVAQRNKYDIFAGILTILIGLMQLIEYFLWKNQDCLRTNHNLSLLIMILLSSQPIVASLAHMYLFTETSIVVIALCVLFAFFTMYLVHFLNKMKMCSCPSENSCRLVWAPFQALLTPFIIDLKNVRISPTNLYKFVLMGIFLVFYFGLFIYAYGVFDNVTKGGYLKIPIGFTLYPVRYYILPVTFILSFVYAFFKEGVHYADIMGSFWCFNAAAFGIVSVFHI